MPLLDIVVPGDPVPKGRPRIVRTGVGVRAFTPEKTARWEQDAAAIMQRGWYKAHQITGAGVVELEACNGPLSLTVTAVFKRPQRLLRKCDPAERMPHERKPDLDNVVKSVCDALTIANVIRDDSRICHISAAKVFAAKGEAAHVAVTLDRA